MGAQRRELVLPESVVALMRQLDAVSRAYARPAHQIITAVPRNRGLTTQAAADLLNISRPYLIRLLGQGAMPYMRTGTHKRIRFDDLLRYKADCDAKRGHALDELTQLNQEMGLYDA